MVITAESLHTLGCQAQAEGDYVKAGRYYQQSLAIKPDYAVSLVALSQLRMMQTCFREGREMYEARLDARGEADGPDWRQLPFPRWRGEGLAGKKLYLWAEQGFGDVIMFAGFLPCLLAQRPTGIVLGMFPKMMPLFARSFPEVVVEPLSNAARHALAPVLLEAFPKLMKLAGQSGTPASLQPLQRDYKKALQQGSFDYAAPMGDLLVHCLPDVVPAKHQLSYLIADPQRINAMQAYADQFGPGRRIGISWYTQNVNSETVRSIPLPEWQPVLNISGCNFFSLQHHVMPEEIERFSGAAGCRIILPPFDPVQDTEGLAALTACMDEVISIDNSNAHLAGALGIPTTLLLPRSCNFRWPVLADGTDTLWYRSVKAERQEMPADWQPVIARVAEGLRRRATADREYSNAH